MSRPQMLTFTSVIIHDASHAKGKASTAKQTCLGSLLALKLNFYCVFISPFCAISINWASHRATRAKSSSNQCTWGVVAHPKYKDLLGI